jgi:hypothetical protein
VLAPDGELPSPPAGEYRLAVGVPYDAAGMPATPTFMTRSDGFIANYGTVSLTVYVLILEPAGADATPSSS